MVLLSTKRGPSCAAMALGASPQRRRRGKVLLGGSDGAEGKVCKKGSVFSAPISDKYDDAIITFINDRTRHAGFLNFFKLVYI